VENNVVVNTVIDLDFIQQSTEDEVAIAEVREVTDPAAAADMSETGDGTVAAFTGEIAVEGDSEPAETSEPAEVEAPTATQDVAQETSEGAQPSADGAEAPSEDAPAEDEPAADAPAGDQPAA